MRVRLDLRIDGDDFYFGTDVTGAKARLANLLIGLSERVSASNDPSHRNEIVDDLTGQPLGQIAILIQQGSSR